MLNVDTDILLAWLFECRWESLFVQFLEIEKKTITIVRDPYVIDPDDGTNDST
jgi:hypothetical protein